MPNSVNHQPWDDGALRTLSELIQQRTIKTYCGRRVPFQQADERQPVTCPVCRAKVAEREAALARIREAFNNEMARLDKLTSDERPSQIQ